MFASWPHPSEVKLAIELYISIAFEPGKLPPSVKSASDLIRNTSDEEFYHLSLWECDGQLPPRHLAIRLGSRFYPHMKFEIFRRPDGLGFVYGVDRHDQHVLQSRAGKMCEEFQHIILEDGKIAQRIESAWQDAGLATRDTSPGVLSNSFMASLLP